MKRSLLSGALCTLWIAAGCSVDAGKNPLYRRGKCEAGERAYMGFCLSNDSPAPPVDAGTQCDRGEVRVCYDGEPTTVGRGICKAGTQTCQDDNTWGPCDGQTLPDKEVCNGYDDDCDNVLDEVANGGECSSSTKKGACAKGVSICVSGDDMCWSSESIRPQKEACGAEDLDCDGVPGSDDPDSWEPCYAEGMTGCVRLENGTYQCTGSCKSGFRRCVGAELGECEGAVYPQDEQATIPNDAGVYEIFDEDCDGAFDETSNCDPSVEYKCYTGSADTRGRGTCKPGTLSCNSDGTLGSECVGEVLPVPESCANHNRTDDDCNGEPDDIPGIGQPCNDLGTDSYCTLNAVRDCDPKSSSADLSCMPGPAEPGGERCDEIDNNCDGNVDESCNNGTRSCCPGAGCVDMMSNNDHCGQCGNQCQAGALCCNGTCTNVNTVNNCKGCGLKCGALEACTDRGCKILGLL